MKLHLYLFNKHMSMIFFVLITCTFSAFGQGFSTETEARLQKVLDNFYNDPENPIIGGMLAAVKVDGLASWQGAVGYAARNIDANNHLQEGGTPLTVHTLSRIFSITKTFTAPLVLQLALEGYFNLDDPIIKYLPLMNVYNSNLSPLVTIRQLLNHESGFSDWEETINLQIAIAFNPNKVWSPYELMAFTNQDHAPGTIRRYSHNNYVFLGAIIEATTGKPVEQLYRERFFTPLGFSSMYFAGRESIGNRGVLAAPHDNISPFNPIFQITGQPTFPNSYTNISRFPFTAIESLDFTGGGIISNIAELAEWGNALFGGRATSKAVVDAMLQSISPTPDEFGNYLGYGIKRYDKISATEVFIGHNGSAPGYRSVMVYNPDRKMTIAVLSNFAGIDPYAVAKALFEALPNFIGGNENRKEAKIILCWKGNNITVARPAADGFIKKGAYLGGCSQIDVKKNNGFTTDKDKQVAEQNSLKASPNPFHNKVTISFTTVQPGAVTLGVYDIYGKLLAMPFNGVLDKSVVKHVDWNAGNLPAGIYFCRLQTVSGLSELRIVSKR